MSDTKAELKRILLGVLGSQISPPVSEQLSLMTAEDWEMLLAMAGRLHVLPLFAHRLLQPSSGVRLPPAVREHLRQTYLMNAARNFKLQRELVTIATALEARGIQIIVLKGLHLAQTIYGNIALRQIGDIDILVAPHQAQSAHDGLLAIGYQHRVGQPREGDIEGMLSLLHHMAPLVKPGCAAVEIHTNITAPNQHFSIDVAEIWMRSVPLSLAGTNIRGLSAEDLLLHICEHASYQHQFEWGLRPSCDIAQIIQHFGMQLDWLAFCERAERWGWIVGVSLALVVASELVGASVPQSVVDRLGIEKIGGDIVRTAIDQTLAGPLRAAMTPDLAAFWGQTSLFARLRQFVASVLRPPAVMTAIYPVRPRSPALIWYYLVRVRSVLRRYWRTAWSLQRGDDPALNDFVRRKNVLREFLLHA